ncbi:MAG: type IX secretion system protein PorQ [Bacteroidia bacterium]
MLRSILVIYLLAITCNAFGQIGGNGVFYSLNLPPSARAAALGGYQIAVIDNELTLGFQNPALLNDQMHRQVTFNQVNYISDINFGYAGYAHSLDSLTTILGGVQYINYGDFIRADEYGNINGNFSGDESIIAIGIGRKWKHGLSFGVNAKFIYSHLATYYSSGLAFDLGATYNRPDYQFVASLVVRNLGIQFNSYSNTREQLPLDIQLGISKKLANAPFRFNIMAQHLNTPNMSYLNPNAQTTINLETGEPELQTVTLGDNIMRHFVIGTDLLLSKNFHIRVGYNHQMRKELALDRIKGGVGYSWGFGLRVWRFHVDYARTAFHIGGASHVFSATSNISSWIKKEG